MLDIDNFKAVNDGRGRLVDIARYVQTHLRPCDLIFRYGGEEFLLCMPGTDIEAAHEICDRLRQELAGLGHAANGDQPFQVTVSVGVAEIEAGIPVEEALDHADRALFAAAVAVAAAAPVLTPRLRPCLPPPRKNVALFSSLAARRLVIGRRHPISSGAPVLRAGARLGCRSVWKSEFFGLSTGLKKILRKAALLRLTGSGRTPIHPLLAAAQEQLAGGDVSVRE